MSNNNTTIPSLNGVRALSVLLVAASHCGFGNIVPGGLGVTVFFFLSGFLITSLLQQEFDATGQISLRNFYVRRLFRLSPPFLIALAIATILSSLRITDGTVTWPGSLAQIFYFANYYQIFWDAPHTTPGGTAVFWSLAVEEHFYFVYPVCLLWIMNRFSRRSTMMILLGACIAVLGWRFFLIAQPDFRTDRIYLATDTRIDSILWGCLLGVAWRKIRNLKTTDLSGKRVALLLVSGLALLALSLGVRGTYFRETIRYTLQGAALLPIFVAIIARKSGPVFHVLNSAALVRLGEYSYAFYLIHFIIVNLLTKNFQLDRHPILLFAVVVVISVAYAKAISTFVERPIKIVRTRLGIESVEPAAAPSNLQSGT